MNRYLAGILMMPGLGMAQALPQNDRLVHEGVATCAASQCHGSAVPRDGSNVFQNEYVTWTQNDPHSGAYQALNGELSLAIARRLGIGDPREADICLDCHADNVAAGRRGERFQISDGVSCEACHGGAQKWLSTHYNAPAVSHADNVAAGLYPGDQVKARADLCLSCHLGTRDKFATHRIMAAGHPRLAFELDTFTELWRTAGRQPHYRVDADYRQRKAVNGHGYTWGAGLVADGRQRLALIMSPGFAGGAMFPELGLYDCHACHRSMKSVQWRRLPRQGGAGPGVPFINDSSFVMIVALARALDPDNAGAIESSLTELHLAGSNSVTAIQSAAKDLDAGLRKLQSGLTEGSFRNREKDILAEILKSGARREFLDYESAEQAFMAVQMLVFELRNDQMQAEIDMLGDALQDDERYRPAQFARLLERFSALD
ncbi:MAG: cytochrome c family protein [Gammaproteobacteria bacterium]|nr:cytochrome c family protein [Gammaproteobacteria bacterium]MDH4315503.1 cytochrome c family protein [Gammaproteobacteria bacterium]MDH5214639.1 cytochrome c family protein [Gammaproteobacteria bacterium]